MSSPKQSEPIKLPSFFKKNKITLVQKQLNLDKLPLTIQALSIFYQDSSSLEVHIPLIALLVQDKSSSAINLTNSILKKLFPATQQKTLQQYSQPLGKILAEIAVRTNYGIDSENLPESLYVWRWEVNIDLLPADIQQSVKDAREKRVLFHQNVMEFWNSISDDQKKEIQNVTSTPLKRRIESNATDQASPKKKKVCQINQ